MRFELDRIAAAHLAQVLMCPQIPHIGGGTGLHTKVTDEIDAVDIRFIFPVEKTKKIIVFLFASFSLLVKQRERQS